MIFLARDEQICDAGGRYVRHPIHLGGPCIGRKTLKSERYEDEDGKPVERAYVKISDVKRSSAIWYETLKDCKLYNEVCILSSLDIQWACC